jgi:hypothetical protein
VAGHLCAPRTPRAARACLRGPCGLGVDPPAVSWGLILAEARRNIAHTRFTMPFDGRILLASEDGDTLVLSAGDTYHEIAKNSLGEMSLATPAAADDSLFVRTQTKLYRVAR